MRHKFVQYSDDFGMIQIRGDSFELNIRILKWFPVSQKKLKQLLKIMEMNDWYNELFSVLGNVINVLDHEADFCLTTGDQQRANRIWKNVEYLEFYMDGTRN